VSLEELARLSGVKLSTLHQCRLRRDLWVGMLWKLARALDVPCTAFAERPSHAMLLPRIGLPRAPPSLAF
jgi:hypothetical protein